MKNNINWKLFIDKNEILDKKCSEILTEFITSKDLEPIVEMDNTEEVKKDTEDLLSSISFYEKEYIEREKNQGNEQPKIEFKYAGSYLKKIIMYHIFIRIFRGKYHLLEEIAKERCCYKKIGKTVNSYDDIYGQSAILDLVIYNVMRGSFYKKEPHNLKKKAEYSYDKDGKLLMGRWYDENEVNWWTEFWIYSEEYILRIGYHCLDETKDIGKIGFQKYIDGYIVESENARIHDFRNNIDKICEIDSEKYEYSMGNLKQVFREEYISSITSEKELLKGQKYIFEKNKEGYLKGYILREFWNGKEKPYHDNFVVLSEKKQRDSGKDANRWRIPNYFREETSKTSKRLSGK